MSANNEIILRKRGKKWKVIHNDLDCGPISKIGEFDSLEEASDKANEFIRKCEEDGYGVEYGIRIEK